MKSNDLIDEMNDQKESTFDFEKELAAFKKRDRRKMLVAGFVAGVMLAVGVAMYMADANANSDSYNYQYSQSGDYGSGSASYADYSSQSAGGAGGAGGGCCGTGGSSLADVSLSDLEKQALDQYKKEKASADKVTAKAASYGCHIQIDISDKSGKIVRSYGYRGDQIYVIS